MSDAHGTIVFVDDDEDLLAITSHWLEEENYDVTTFSSGEGFLAGLSQVIPEVICLDLRMPGLSGIETLRRLQTHYRDIPVIIVTAVDDTQSVVSLMQLGAYDYLVKPITKSKLLTSIRNAVERHRMALELARLEREARGGGYYGIVGESPPMRQLFRQMDRVAGSDITVVIYGQSGTGKELVARAIHENSGRQSGPFVALNCAAIPESLQESELFGHEKGSFTGATARRTGRFEQANGGTLFLDEVAELSQGLQAKLLRVLQEHRFSRVGGNQEITTDIRLLAATHRDLASEVQANRFRDDLFFRLAVLELEVPLLRERGATDILLLARTFLSQLAEQEKIEPPRISSAAQQALTTYEWPGNVRELHNAIHRAYVLCDGDRVDVKDLPPRLVSEPGGFERFNTREISQPKAEESHEIVTPENACLLPEISLEAMERRAIEEALVKNRWNLSAVGRQLGIGRTTLYRKLKKFGLK